MTSGVHTQFCKIRLSDLLFLTDVTKNKLVTEIIDKLDFLTFSVFKYQDKLSGRFS